MRFFSISRTGNGDEGLSMTNHQPTFAPAIIPDNTPFTAAGRYHADVY
jgi:hypothetical protein